MGPKIKIGLFAVGRPTPKLGPKLLFFHFAFAVNPDLYFLRSTRILYAYFFLKKKKKKKKAYPPTFPFQV